MPGLILVAPGMPDFSGGEYNVLAFDYGEARVGIAVANSLLKIPHPLITVSAKSIADKLVAITPLIGKWQPKMLVVGLPEVSDNPQKIQLINTIKNFAGKLQKQFDLPVELVDESLTSSNASFQLTQQGVNGKKQKVALDQLAACGILETFFAR